MMPYKNICFSLTALFLYACSGTAIPYYSLEDQFAEIIKSNLKDSAFKNTASVNIYSLNILKIDTVTSAKLDSQLLIKTTERFNICTALSELYQSMAKMNARIGALNKKKKNTEPGNVAEEMEGDAYQALVYDDSARFYSHLLDSLHRIRINNNVFSDTLYQVKTFLKATEKKNNDSTNYLGTRYFFITKDKKILNVPDLK